MNIIKLMTILRKFFTLYEIPEMPAFPASLCENWCHPDLYLSMKGSKLGPCFTFQTFLKPDGFLSANTTKTPDLIWLVNSDGDSSSYINEVRRFFEILSTEIIGKSEENNFNFQADMRRKKSPGEMGAFWKIIFAGVECGRLSLYSSLPGANLSKLGSGILTLQLNKIVSVITSTHFSIAVPWVGNLSASSSMAMHAWQQLEENNNLLPAHVFDTLSASCDGDSENSLIEKFCRVFRVYNNYSRQINADSKLYDTFVNIIKKMSDKILVLQESSIAKQEKVSV